MKSKLTILAVVLLISASLFVVTEFNQNGTENIEVIVNFNSFEKVSPDLLTGLGSEILSEFTSIPSIEISIPQNLVKYVNNLPGVASIEFNQVYQKDIVPNDPLYANLYGMDIISAPQAWDITTGSSSVIVAVIDEGVDINHEDLSTNIWTNTGEIPNNGIDDDGNGFIDDVNGWNFFNNNNQVYGGNPTQDTHGTHVSGTIGGIGNNGVGVAGVSWNVQIMPIKFLGPTGGSTADAISSIEYATAMGANIISASWGGGGFSTALQNAINAFPGLFVAAAGNSGLNTDISPHYPSSYDSANILSVASTTSTDARSGFSNFGAISVDLAAPGSSILSTYPADNYATISGTSMATPHVSGAAALILSNEPTLSTAQLKSRIMDNVDPVGSMQGISVTGGRLNVFNAIQAGGPPPTDTIAPSVTINSPIGTVSGTVAVDATITDNVGVTAADYSIDGGPFQSLANSGGSWTANLDTTSLSDGSHTIEVRGFDAAGNQGSNSGTFTVDNALPPQTNEVTISDHTETFDQYREDKGELKGMVSSVSGVVTGSPTNIVVTFSFPASWSLKSQRGAILNVNGGADIQLAVTQNGNSMSMDISAFVGSGDSFTLQLETEWEGVPAGSNSIEVSISFFDGVTTQVVTNTRSIIL